PQRATAAPPRPHTRIQHQPHPRPHLKPEGQIMTTATPAHITTPRHGYISDKERYLARLRRIEGQARGIHRMIDDDTYCIDILTQSGTNGSRLNTVAVGVVDDHLEHGVAGAIHNGGTEADETLQEASEAVARLVNS